MLISEMQAFLYIEYDSSHTGFEHRTEGLNKYAVFVSRGGAKPL